MPESEPSFLKYFEAFHEDYPISKLPADLQTCGDCGADPSGCHLLVANGRGRKKGIESVLIRFCNQCNAVHLSQMFVPDFSAAGLDLSHLEAIAAHFRGDAE